MNPPMVAPAANPNSHRTSRIAAIVYNIRCCLFDWLVLLRIRLGDQLGSLAATGAVMVMLLITLFTPLMSVASLVTRLFSASFLAMPLKVTTPSDVEILVCKALVEWCDSNDDLTWAVMEASSILSPVVSLGMAGFLAIVISFLTDLTLSTSLAYSVVSSFSARLEASPCRVTIPFFTYTFVPVALTLRWNRSADFTFRPIHVSECSAGCSPLTSS